MYFFYFVVQIKGWKLNGQRLKIEILKVFFENWRDFCVKKDFGSERINQLEIAAELAEDWGKRGLPLVIFKAPTF